MKAPWVAVSSMAVVIGGLTLAVALGYRINTTESMPRGIWRATPVDGTLVRGETVAVCLPLSIYPHVQYYIGAGDCPSGLEPVLKTIGAVAGDTVVLDKNGARVNGVQLWNTAPLSRDSFKRDLQAWPFGVYYVEEGEIFLFSTYSAQSFDSRYFGPVNTDAVIARGVPVLTWK